MRAALGHSIQIALLLSLAMAARAALGAGAAPAPDSLHRAPGRVVLQLKELVVRASVLHDPLSGETVRIIPSGALGALPADRLADLLSLQAGVVARGEDLHVRGGRAGEAVTQLQGFPLEDPFRARRPELPFIAIRDAELVSGGQDAEYGGALAGVLNLRTLDPGSRWEGAASWHTDGRLGGHYDRAGARWGGPLPGIGLGVMASAEASLDDGSLPSPRTVGRQSLLGGSFGWRAYNRLAGDLKIVTPDPSSRLGLEVVASRRVDRPYDPMWSLDGYTCPCVDPDTCLRGPGYSATPKPGYDRYRAADHQTMTDERRLASILSWQRAAESQRLLLSIAWLRTRSITSLNGLDDERYITRRTRPSSGTRTPPPAIRSSSIAETSSSSAEPAATTWRSGATSST